MIPMSIAILYDRDHSYYKLENKVGHLVFISMNPIDCKISVYLFICFLRLP